MVQTTGTGALYGVRAMPQKAGNSDGQSSFNIARRIFTETTVPSSYTSIEQKQKKLFGNHDASQVTSNRRNSQIGKGSLNLSGGLMSLNEYNIVNTTNDALRRVRAGGAVASQKKRANLNNAPTKTYTPIPNKQLYGLKSPSLNH
jgi:hypothetical protein